MVMRFLEVMPESAICLAKEDAELGWTGGSRWQSSAEGKGASRHMTGCLENFSRTIPIKGGAPVYIPNEGMDRTSRRTIGMGELQGGSII
ncbi:hypothetical protein CRG98_026106 [Punica granatum]|uniref:Uncharacterized protein n=1 Tax=Punica granatum TaxID=22663 RepID=A0A2I0JC52_PUNGR|nr:hypothetical protein CRG98_026106 [Punica granatum]